MANRLNNPKHYTNDHLILSSIDDRLWVTNHFFSLWFTLGTSIPTWLLVGYLGANGMAWWQQLLTMVLASALIIALALATGAIGSRYGVPFPVAIRSGYGLRGAWIIGFIKAVVSMVWFGCLTWVGGLVLYVMLKSWNINMDALPTIFSGDYALHVGKIITSVVFLIMELGIVFIGFHNLRHVLIGTAVLSGVISLSFLITASATNGAGPLITSPSYLFDSASSMVLFLFGGAFKIAGVFATLCLTIPDFTRFARRKRNDSMGQSFGIPLGLIWSTFVVLFVASAMLGYRRDHGEKNISLQSMWDPITTISKVGNTGVVTVVCLFFIVSLLIFNVCFALVDAGLNLTNLFPRLMGYKSAAVVAGILGLVGSLPWRLVGDNPFNLVELLFALSNLFAPVFAIVVLDYYLLRRRVLDVDDIYCPGGIYWYHRGFNHYALLSTLLGLFPVLISYLLHFNVFTPSTTFPLSVHTSPWLHLLTLYTWPISFLLAFALYGLMSFFVKDEYYLGSADYDLGGQALKDNAFWNQAPPKRSGSYRFEVVEMAKR